MASLAWLGRREVLSIHPGKTNHDYEIELNRRTREFPAARGLFAGNVAAFERAWYGLYAVSAEESCELSPAHRRIEIDTDTPGRSRTMKGARTLAVALLLAAGFTWGILALLKTQFVAGDFYPGILQPSQRSQGRQVTVR